MCYISVMISFLFGNIFHELFRWFKFTLKPPYSTAGIGHLGHFRLDFFCQIWTQDTLRHILGPIMAKYTNMSIFDSSRAVQVIFQKMGAFRKSKISRKWLADACFSEINMRWADDWAMRLANF